MHFLNHNTVCAYVHACVCAYMSVCVRGCQGYLPIYYEARDIDEKLHICIRPEESIRAP